MKLLWHLVAKDVRRFGPVVLLWALVIALRHQVGLWALAGGAWEDERFSALCQLHNVLTFLDWSAGALLAVALVQADAPTGSTEFWMTRPVGALRLLGAKLVAVALLLGVLPLVVALRWWLANGYDGELISAAAGHELAVRGAWMLAVIVVAALARNFLSFAVWAPALWLGLWLIAMGARWLVKLKSIAGAPSSHEGEWMAVAMVGVGLGALVLHYTRRRVAWTVGWLVIGSVACGAMSGLRFGKSMWVPPPEPAEARGITVSVDAIKRRSDSSYAPWSLKAELTLHGLPETKAVSVSLSPLLTWPNGTKLQFGSSGAQSVDYCSAVSSGWAEWQALGLPGKSSDPAVRGLLALSWPVRAADQLGLILDVWPQTSDEGPRRSNMASYRATVNGQLLRPRLVAERALNVGSVLTERGGRVRVMEVRRNDGGAVVGLIESMRNSQFAEESPDDEASDLHSRIFFANSRFFLVNRERGEAAWLTFAQVEQRRWRVSSFDGQSCTPLLLQAELPMAVRAGGAAAEERWLAGARLAWVRYEFAGGFFREGLVGQVTIETKEEKP